MSKKNSNRNLIVRFIIYGLIGASFLAAYFFNEHLKATYLTRLEVEEYSLQSIRAYDMVLHQSHYFIVAMVIVLAMAAVIDWSVFTSRHSNKFSLVIPGIILYGVVLVCLLDMTVGEWGIPGRCGSGFSEGNCFWAEGLGEIIYIGIIPVAFIVGTALLSINKYKKRVR